MFYLYVVGRSVLWSSAGIMLLRYGGGISWQKGRQDKHVVSYKK